MDVQDLQVYRYTVLLEPGELPARLHPRFGPAFAPRALCLVVSTADDDLAASVHGPVDERWHPSHDTPRVVGSAMLELPMPVRVAAEAARQVRADAAHLEDQARRLRELARRLCAPAPGLAVAR